MSKAANRQMLHASGGLRSVPKPALGLGFAGLIPFVALAGAVLLGQLDVAAFARPILLAYAIAILAFMGAVHWGLAMQAADGAGGDSAWRKYAVSVLPALAGAATPMLIPQLQFAWLALCFAGLLGYDLMAASRAETPSWYPALRWPLTVVVCLCLGAVAAFEF